MSGNTKTDYTFIQSMNPGNKAWNSGVWAKKLQTISENKVKGVNYTEKVIARAKIILKNGKEDGKVPPLVKGLGFFPIRGGLTSPHL